METKKYNGFRPTLARGAPRAAAAARSGSAEAVAAAEGRAPAARSAWTCLLLRHGKKILGRLRQCRSAAPDHTDLQRRQVLLDRPPLDTLAFQRPGTIENVRQDSNSHAAGNQAAHRFDG